MDFRQIIADELKKQNMTQMRLAALAGMTIPRVSDYLTGKRDVYAQTLANIFKALHLEVRPADNPPGKPRTRKGR